MSVVIKGQKHIPWKSPAGCPDGFEPSEVHLGKGNPNAAIEVAVARWKKGPTIPREALTKLHELRVNKRATPVVLAVELDDGSVITFGPSKDAAPLRALPAEQAERLYQAVLDEPNAILARQRIAAMAAAIDTTTLLGVKNSGLFANHELRVGVPQRPDWADACSRSMPMLKRHGRELVQSLGYTLAQAGPNALVLTGDGPRPQAIAVLLNEDETFDSESKRFAISPVAYGLRVAEQQGVAWLIMVRGTQLRLYPARIDIGVGRKGLAETYFEVDLPHLSAETAGYVDLVFSAAALAEGGTTYEILASSGIYAVGLGERLRDKVYEDIIPDLALAVAEELIDQGVEMDAEGLDLAYQLTLRIFFRLLFQVYAEDRRLLPYGSNPKYDRNALKTVAKDLAEHPDQEFDAESQSLWDDLAQVWRVIDAGDRAWAVPPYNGGLFATDEELHPHGALIAKISIRNDVMGPVLRALLLDDADDDTLGPIDFRALSVREFGTIYEGLLESSLSLAEVDLTVDDKGTWLPAKKKSDEVYAEAGQVYFHNTSGQRKGTGSYFTPSFVVEHLLERALDPALDEHLARIAAMLDAGDQASAADAFFDFRVADLAMGSGHFLTAAIDHIEQKMAAFLAEPGHQIPGVAKELSLLNAAAVEALGPDAGEPDPASLLRRQIARRCIYGLDINPIAVELARVSIWIHTFVRGLPMSSLDHNLVCANSLTGIGSIDEALDVLVPGRKGAPTLFDAPITDALTKARTVLLDVSMMPELDRNETRAAAKAVQQAHREAATARHLFDAAVLLRVGRTDLINEVDVAKIAKQAASTDAREAVGPLQAAHMPELFPEAFLRENPGFDVLIGNPPWKQLMVDELRFWLRAEPGILALRPKELQARVTRLRKVRSDLMPLLQREVAAFDVLRQAITAGPFPGIGGGGRAPDLYYAFAWRNLQLVRGGGRIGAVFPRTLLSAAISAPWRRHAFSTGDVGVVTVTNAGQWVFEGVDGRYSIALVNLRVAGGHHESDHQLQLSGPFFDRAAFGVGAAQGGTIDAADLLADETAAVPQLPDGSSAAVFAHLRGAPRLDRTTPDWEFRPVYEFNATTDRTTFDAGDRRAGRWPVYGGSSFNIWEPETGEYYAWANPKTVINALYEKRLRQIRLKSSAFFGLGADWADDPLTLPCCRPRIAFRDVTNATNTRTCIAALVPGGVVIVNSAPYLLRARGTAVDEAYLLGVLCSIPLDWYSRRYVELHLNFHIFNGLPIPRPAQADERRGRVVELAGCLAAKDERFAEWASAVGVPVGSVTSAEQQADMEAELDALVAHLYCLSREQVEHIFATFHRGWDYRPRLDAALAHFDRIEA